MELHACLSTRAATLAPRSLHPSPPPPPSLPSRTRRPFVSCVPSELLANAQAGERSSATLHPREKGCMLTCSLPRPSLHPQDMRSSHSSLPARTASAREYLGLAAIAVCPAFQPRHLKTPNQLRPPGRARPRSAGTPPPLPPPSAAPTPSHAIPPRCACSTETALLELPEVWCEPYLTQILARGRRDLGVASTADPAAEALEALAFSHRLQPHRHAFDRTLTCPRKRSCTAMKQKRGAGREKAWV